MPPVPIGVTPPSANARSRSWISLIVVVLLAWQIVLVWIFPHFVTQDGPSHLYNAALIRNFRDPAWRRVPEFYRQNPHLVPNWCTYAVLAELYRWFSPSTAEKIIVTAYFIIFPLSFVYVLRALKRDSYLFAVWGLVLANNLFIAMGFYNFCYSLILFLLSFGYWMRARDRFGLKQLITLCALVSLLYFSHVVGFFMAAFFIGVAALCFLLAEGSPGAKAAPSPAEHEGTHAYRIISVPFSEFFKRILLPQLAFLPGLVVFFVSSIGSQPAFDPGKRGFWQRLLLTRDLHVLVESRGAWAIAQMSLVGGFLLWGAWLVAKGMKQEKPAIGNGLGIPAITCLFLASILPWSISGGGMLPERMAWFALCAALLWLSSNSGEWRANAQRAAIGVSTLVVILGLINQTQWRSQLSPMLDAYDHAGSLLAPQKTILLLCYCNPADNSDPVFAKLRIRPLEHAGDIAALAGRALSLDNYEAMGTAFPLEYNASVNPDLNSNTLSAALVSSTPQSADIAAYEAKTGKTVDYVLLWGCGAGDPGDGGSVLSRQLQSNYEVIYTSPPPAILRLFQRRRMSAMLIPSKLGKVVTY